MSEPLKSLEARYYTDPKVYEMEMDGLFARTWQFAGHASQLEKAGNYFAFEMAGESLFAVCQLGASIPSGEAVNVTMNPALFFDFTE